MKKVYTFPRPLILVVMTLILITLACGILSRGSNGIDADIQQTLDALVITQAAHETLVAEEPVQPTEESIIEEAPQPTEEFTTEEPVTTETELLAPHEIDTLYEGISFSFVPEVAHSANAEIVPGEDYGPDGGLMSSFPTHHKFTLSGYGVVDHIHTPTILVYPVEEYGAICPSAAEIINRLEQIIRTQSTADLRMMPFLPIMPAAQFFASNLGYVDFQNGSGVRFLTAYGHDIFPISNYGLFYTFQGLTDDGRYYVSAILPITHPELPGENEIDRWQSDEEFRQTYAVEKTDWLNAQAITSFNPSMTDLDSMIATILVDR